MASDGGPAFPVDTRFDPSISGYGHQTSNNTWQYGGMTLRQHYAGLAMQAIISKLPLFDADGQHGVQSTRQNNSQIYADVSESAFFYADAMISEDGKAK